jgi:hypothetical protein
MTGYLAWFSKRVSHLISTDPSKRFSHLNTTHPSIIKQIQAIITGEAK